MENEAMSNGYTPKEEEKSWERAWTLDEMRQKSHNWSLASDAGMLQYLQSFSQRLLNRTHQIQEEVNGLIHESKLTGVRIGNTFNDFIMLANTQFVENRVYDEDVSSTVENGESDKSSQKEKSKEEKEAELIPRLAAAVKEGMSVIDTAFERLDVNEANSDSEEETPYKTDALLEPKDPYITRPLPHIIGTQAFFQDDDVGLIDTFSEDEAGSDHGSLSESDMSDTQQAPAPQLSDDEYSDSLSEEEEEDGDLFGVTPAAPHSDTDEESFSDEQTEQTNDFASELGAKLGIRPSVDKGSQKDIRQKEKTSTRKHKQRQSVETDDPFSPPIDDGEDDDDEDLFAPKQGIFSSSRGLFDDDDDQDVQPQNRVHKKKVRSQPPQLTDVTPRSSLSSLGRDEDTQPSAHQPQNDNLFADEGGIFDELTTNDRPSKKPATKAEPRPASITDPHQSAQSLFDEEQQQDEGLLFGGKSKEVKQRQTASSLFDDEDEEEDDGDLFADLGKIKPSRKSAAKEDGGRKGDEKKIPAGAVSMFGGAGNPLMASLQKSTPSQSSSPDVLSSQKSEQDFDVSSKPESEDEDLFAAPSRKVKQTVAPPAVKKQSLFVDDDEEEDEGDLFSSLSRPAPAKPTVSSGAQKTVPVKKVSLFGESPPGSEDLFSSSQPSRQQKPKKVSLFGDEDDIEPSVVPPKATKQKAAAGRSLFDEDDSPQTEEPEVDLFGPSSPLASPKASISTSTKAPVPSDQVSSPLDLSSPAQSPTGKKMPPGAVSMFGGSTGQLTAALQAGHHIKPEEPGPEQEDEEDGLFSGISEPSKVPPPNVKKSPFVDEEDEDEDDLFSEHPVKVPPSTVQKPVSSEPLLHEDEDDLFAKKPDPVKVPPTTAKKPVASQPFGDDELFSEKSQPVKKPPLTARKPPASEQRAHHGEEDDLFTTKPKPVKLPPPTTKKPPVPERTTNEDHTDDKSQLVKKPPPTARKPVSEPLTDADQENDDLFARTPPEPTTPKKHLPAGAVSMFGGAPNPLLGALQAKTAKHKMEEESVGGEESGAGSPQINSHDVPSHQTGPHDTFYSSQPKPSSVSGSSDPIIDLDQPAHVDTLPSMVKHRAKTNAKRRPPSRLMKTSVQSSGPLSPQTPTDPHDSTKSLNTTASSVFDSYDGGPSDYDKIFSGESSKPLGRTEEDLFTKPQPPPLLDDDEDDDLLSGFKSKTGFDDEDDFFDKPPVVSQTQPSKTVDKRSIVSGKASVDKEAPSPVDDIFAVSKATSKPAPLPDEDMFASSKTTKKPSPLPDDDLFASSKATRKPSPLPDDDVISSTKPTRKPSPLPDDDLFASSKTARKPSPLPDDDLFASSKTARKPSPLPDDDLFASSKTARKPSPLPDDDLFASSKTARKPSPLPDDDLFASSKTAQKPSPSPDIFSTTEVPPKPDPVDDDSIFDISLLSSKPPLSPITDNIFTATKASSKTKTNTPPDDDIFSSLSTPKTTKQLETDDIFSSLPPPSKATTSKVKSQRKDDPFSAKKTSTPSKPQANDIFATGSGASNQPPDDDDDIFRDATKKSRQPIIESDDIFATSSAKKGSDSKSAAPAKENTGKKFRPKKAKTKDEDLFADDTDIFATTTKTEKTKKSKPKSSGDSLFKTDTDDIFAPSTRSVKTTKKKSQKPAASATASAAKTEDIFDDPLSAFNN